MVSRILIRVQTQEASSVVLGPAEFDKMEPGLILVAPLTTPAWTQLFAHAAGLVTDTGSLFAHGSIVAMFSSAFRPRCLPNCCDTNPVLD